MNILNHNYLTRGFWGDEAWTALISQLSLKEITTTTAQDFHPPLYYFLVHFWIKLFGNSEVAIRLLSVLFWILTSFVLYKLCLCFWEKRLAIFTTILSLTNPFIFTYALEARSYELLILLTVTSVFCLLKALENSQSWGIFYLLTAVAGVYTHHYMWFVILAQGIYVFIFDRVHLKRLIPLFLGVFFFYLPWLPVFFQQSKEVAQGYWIPKMGRRTHLDTFVRLIAAQETGGVANLLVFLHLLTFLVAIAFWLKKPRSISPKAGLLLLWFFTPILAPTLISIHKPIYFYRYLVFVSIPLALFVSSSLFNRRIPIVIVIFIILNLALDSKIFTKHPFSMREIFSLIHDQSSSSDIIFTFLPSFAEVAYYNKGQLKIIVSKTGLVQFSGKSLLDIFVSQNRAEIGDSPSQRYWQVEPGPTISLKNL
jgi:uncharacterized membrane protein